MSSFRNARTWTPFITPPRQIWLAWPYWVVPASVPGDCGFELDPWLPQPERLADARWLPATSP